jgi:hypothetical protein
VRKCLAILLLIFNGLPYARSLTLLGSEDGYRLPACCQRNGKHHCMLGSLESAVNSAAWKASLENCPYSPGKIVPVFHRRLLGVPAIYGVPGNLRGSARLITSTTPRRSRSLSGARSERGPPVLSTL